MFHTGAGMTSLLLLATLLSGQPALSRQLGKLDSLKDAIHSAVSDAVQQHCTGGEQAGSRCVSLCPEGFTACAGRCYSLQLTPADYATAERRCAALDSHLAAPRSLAENLCAAGLSGGRRVWLGVTDRGVEGQFRAADGTPLEQLAGHRWWGHQPDDHRAADPSGEDCVEMRMPDQFAAWNDESCRSRLLPLCQYSN